MKVRELIRQYEDYSMIFLPTSDKSLDQIVKSIKKGNMLEFEDGQLEFTYSGNMRLCFNTNLLSIRPEQTDIELFYSVKEISKYYTHKYYFPNVFNARLL